MCRLSVCHPFQSRLAALNSCPLPALPSGAGFFLRPVARRRARSLSVILRYHLKRPRPGTSWHASPSCPDRSFPGIVALMTYAPTISRQDAYHKRQMLKRESRYLDERPSPDEWRSMSACQRAVHERWVRYYRKRRALRELLRGDVPVGTSPGRFPVTGVPSLPGTSSRDASTPEGPRKPRGKK